MTEEHIIIRVNNEELNDKLSKSMKLLGVHYDEYGRLVNAENKYVGGLNQARIKMGDYINAQGQMCDAAGRVLDGLTASELKLRAYKDAEDNVRDALGKLIRISDERIAKLDEEGKKAVDAAMEQLHKSTELLDAEDERTKTFTQNTLKRIEEIEKESAKREAAIKRNEALGKSLNALGGLAGNVAQVAAIFGQTEGAAGRTARAVAKAAQALQVFTSMTQAIKGMKEAYATLTIATKAQEAAQIGLNLASGNLVGIIGGALAAGATLWSMFSSGADESTEAVKKQADTIDRLTVALEKHGTTIRKVSAASAGMALLDTTRIDEAKAKLQELDKISEKVGKAEAKFYESYKAQGAYNQGFYTEKTQALADSAKELRAQQDEIKSDAANALAEIFGEDYQRDPLKELRERADFYAEILDSGALEGEDLARAEAALANNLAKQDEEVQKQSEIAAKEKGYGDFLKKEEAKIVQPETQEELDAAIKKAAGDLGEGSEQYKTVVENMKAGFEKEQKAREKADAEKRLADAEKALGDKFQAYADGSALWTAQEKAAHDLQATIDAWTKNFKDAGRSEQELNTAVANLKQEYKDKQLQEYLSANDLKIKESEKLDAEAQYTETLKKIKEAEEEYGLQAAEAEKLRAQATEELADARMKKAEEEQQERENRLNELGITGLREQMKSPFEKMMEQQAKIQQAQAEGLISAAESNQMQAKLAADYWQQNAQQAESGEQETGFEKEEYRAASSLTAGSNELYQAMTQRESSTERYQTDVKKNLGNMARYSEENYETLQAIQANLANVMQTLGVV